jgi:hypothetical protein
MTFIGDCHGQFARYLRIINSLPAGEPSVQVGDMGIGFGINLYIVGEGFQGAELPELPSQHKFIRGNHDKPEDCRRHPNYLGEFGYIMGKDLFYAGGGYSVDRAYRVEGVDWWRDEQLTSAQMDEAFFLYQQIEPAVMVSHEAPDSLLQAAPWVTGPGKIRSATSTFLDHLWRSWHPTTWIFGHHHKEVDVKLEGTRFIGLPELGLFHLEENNEGHKNEQKQALGNPEREQSRS